ncbi:hypothetical protein T265_09785 [Opisthorchis viverrini]|uniref:DNA topoisomerase n=1 Tax=Opisthorchis viverrini TaxID=6198 RepID=A0A074Z4L6_OPIVI|nr:hypothetical protein T265_09785 [Opisthorchis viverrini]KER22031.1 hypothetical protein T265_09785 [Opisthorchis viverrini]
MSTVFMVAEKPSLAESISKSLSRGRHASRRGFNGACSVHEWTGSFMGGQVRFKMTSVCGHVMTTDFLSRYNNWDRVDPIELFVAPIEKKEANPNLKMVEYLRKEAKNADTLILWLDCDKEGENICFEVIDCVHSVMIPPVTTKEKVKPRPQGLNTVEMLRVASACLGIGPHAAMAVAERLYTSGYINYPRTETTAYPSTFDLRGLVQQQAKHPQWGDVARDLLASGLTPPRKGHDAGDHPPIAPMRMATPGELGHDAARLYEFIAQHFLATVMPDCRYESTQVTLSIGDGELFTLTGIRVLEPGFTRILTRQALSDQTLPDELLVRGAKIPLTGEPTLVEGQTGPPDYLTEAELITAMERHGIGTDASIPTHIENIIQRAYVQLLPGRRLQPTPLGIVLVHGYQAIDPELVLPHMRRAVEEQLNHIANGRAQFEQVLQFVVAIFAAKYRYFIEHILAMDQLFEVSFSSLAESGRPLSRCGKCHRYLKMIDSRPQRLHCPICNETYTVPQNGTIRLYKEVRCPLDDFELLLWSQGTKGKNIVFCPYCFSHPPFPNMPKGSGCHLCLHPTCPQSMESRAVDACPECPNGLLVLDDSTAPKYRFNCNRPNFPKPLEMKANRRLGPRFQNVHSAPTSCVIFSSLFRVVQKLASQTLLEAVRTPGEEVAVVGDPVAEREPAFPDIHSHELNPLFVVKPSSPSSTKGCARFSTSLSGINVVLSAITVAGHWQEIRPEMCFTPPRRARRRMAGLVIPWMLSRRTLRWRFAPPFLTALTTSRHDDGVLQARPQRDGPSG